MVNLLHHQTKPVEEGYQATVNPRTLAVEHALSMIERELGTRLDAVQRAAVTRTLEAFGDDWAYHDRERRWR